MGSRSLSLIPIRPESMDKLTIRLLVCSASFLTIEARFPPRCDYNPYSPCECTNPFLGTENHLLGSPDYTCKVADACYVKSISGCSDATLAKGGGRCQSNFACRQSPVNPVPATGGTQYPSPIGNPGYPSGQPSNNPFPATGSAPNPQWPYPNGNPIYPTAPSPIPFVPTNGGAGASSGICECINQSFDSICSHCEVHCDSDCNDLKNVFGK